MVQAIPDGLWVLDSTGRTVFANDRMAQMLGREPDEMPGFNAYTALDEAGQAQLRQHLHELDTVGEPGDNLECMLLRKDGVQVWALISHTPIVDGSRRPLGWLHRVTEYTEQRRLLDVLSRREQQLAEAQSIAKLGSWEWDVPGDVVHWSDELFRIYELEPGELVPTYAGFLEGIHPDDRSRVNETVTGVFAEGDSFEFEARILRKSGLVAWIRGRGIVARDETGAPIRMSGTAQDITDAKDAEQALALLRAVATAANNADTLAEAVPVIAEEVARYTAWRAVAAYLVPEPGLLEAVRVGAHAPDSDGPPVPAGTRDVAARAAATVDIAMQEADGALLLAAPLVVGGVVTGIFVLCRPGTVVPEGWETDTIFQALAVFTRVAEREEAARSLAAARDEAMSASRAKSEFLATMSHEIRTPLNGVIGLSELLGRTELTERQRRLTDGIEDAGHTLLSLVNDILDLSKIEAGRLELDDVDFDPRATIEQAAGLAAPAARAKSLELAIACHPDLPEVLRGDPVRLGQVVTNLTSNAVKFTARGEVVVRAWLEGEADGDRGGASDGGEVAAARDAARLRVQVSDTGVGIAEEERSRLFDAFSQGDSSTTRQFGGTGLGLAISSRIVAAMGGEIGLSSTPGVGSTFWFTVTFRRGTQQSPDVAQASAELSLQDLRVLVVDDSETNRMILVEQLEAWGATAVAAGSAVEGLIQLEESHTAGSSFDVVVLDYLMPGVDGLQFARRVRKDHRHDATRLLLLSSAAEVDAATLAEAGVDHVLSKPALPHRLMASIAAMRTGSAPPALRQPETAPPDGKVRGQVLLVEDNPVNQMVAEGILTAIGYAVLLAGDGREAVGRFTDSAAEIDAVLMDCQMPVMDGYDATRAIRALEEPGRRVPIIALTAAAVAGERERCLAAGMDDFLTKPVDVAMLRATLDRWTEGSSADASPPEASPSEASPSGASAPEVSAEPPHGQADGVPAVDPDVLDPARLDELLDLDPGDPTMLLRFIGRFGANARRAVEELRRTRDEGTPYDLGRVAHGLKGSAANLGAHRLAELCKQVEHGGDDGLMAEPETLDRVAAEVEAAAGALEAFAAALTGDT